jgi:hypothetical protein
VGLFTFSAPSRHVCLHSCKSSLTWSLDFVYIQRDWSARSCEYDMALCDWSSAWPRDCDVIQILQCDWGCTSGTLSTDGFRYSVLPINSSLLTITLYSSGRMTQSLSWRYNWVQLYIERIPCYWVPCPVTWFNVSEEFIAEQKLYVSRGVRMRKVTLDSSQDDTSYDVIVRTNLRKLEA